ncbi:MAG: hypothetical protein ACXWDE_12295 [Aeromicrobium sp.]
MGILYRGRAMSQLLLAGLLALLLVGCGDDGGTPGGSDSEAATLKGPVTYERGGGFAGRRDRLVVQPDGNASLTTNDGTHKLKLSDSELKALADKLEQTDLNALPTRSTTSPPVADDFAYRVVYEGKTVDTDQEAMPEELSPLVSELGALVDRHGKP